MLNLEQKLRDKSAVVAIIGLGYIGLPLCIYFASAGFKVHGIDLHKDRVAKVNRGISCLAHVSSERLSKLVAAGMIRATTDLKGLEKTDVILMCVPIRMTKASEPDFTQFIIAAEQISRRLCRGQLVIAENTSAPGITSKIMRSILEKSGLKAGTDFYLAYSPERTDPGRNSSATINPPKLVGGINAESARLTCLLYQNINKQIVAVSSIETAELTKIFENVFRSVNIALVNELAMLCEKMNINVWEVIRAASSKPFGYMAFYPGLGTGGHNVPLDPHLLAAKAREYDFHTRFIELAADINEQMPAFVTGRLADALGQRNMSIKGSNLLVLGITYKKDTADVRGSPALKLLNRLRKLGASVCYHDPYIPDIELSNIKLRSIKLTKSILKTFDCVIISVAHSSYDVDDIVKTAQFIYDISGVTVDLKSNNIIRLGC